MAVRLFTFGGLRLEADGGPVTGGPAQRRRLALLALLAAAGARGLSREKAFGYLWPEHSAARARHLLSESIYVLRRFLGDSAIAATQDELRLNTDLLWSDVVAFRSQLSDRAVEEASALYCGPFLDGFFLNDADEFDAWVSVEREKLSGEYGRALQRAAENAVAAGQTVVAAEWWGRLAAHDPYSSRIALHYMNALVNAGNRARAIQHAAAYSEKLRSDIGVEPDVEVQKLAAQLQRSTGAPNLPAQITDDPSVPASVSWNDLAPEFELVRSIGNGRLGNVYLARELALRRLVAVKVLPPELASNDAARQRFEREAQSAARIQHPNVATAFRFGRLASGAPFIVMPYVSGGSLEDRLAASGPVPVAEAQRIIAQIASALAAAHRLGIVHRDVRPANVLFDRESDRVLLTDFGLAAVLDTGTEAALRLTRPGEQIGEITYASPEQARGDVVSERADVYSLGVLAFEMLTGRLPYDAKSPMEMLLAHASAEPRRLRDLVPDVPSKIEALLGRCLNKRPEQRPFVDEIERTAF